MVPLEASLLEEPQRVPALQLHVGSSVAGGVSMKCIQEVTVDGEDLVVSIYQARRFGKGKHSSTPMKTRTWKGAAKYIYATKDFADKGAVFVLAVPVTAGLDFEGANVQMDGAL